MVGHLRVPVQQWDALQPSRAASPCQYEVKVASRLIKAAFKEKETTVGGMTDPEMWQQVEDKYNEHAIQQVAENGSGVTEVKVNGLIDALTTATLLKVWWVECHKRASQLRLQRSMPDVVVDLTSACPSVVTPDEAARVVPTATSSTAPDRGDSQACAG